MNQKRLLMKFINVIQRKKLLTEFLADIFEYDDFHDYNYLFRMVNNDDEIIIDIYDNVSDNRFNRYVLNYNKGKIKTRVVTDNNVYVNYIDVFNIKNGVNKLYDFIYITTLDKDKIIIYANTVLKSKFVNILKEIINKPM